MGAGRVQMRRGDRALILRAALACVAVLAVVAVGMMVPVPGVETARAWAESTGRWFILLFLVAHIVITVFPIPRTMFTVSAGLLFGPTVGISVCVLASTLAAVIAFTCVRAIDARHPAAMIQGIRAHPAYAPIAARIRARGWLAVGALRLIAAMPFSVLNYAAALSPVRLWPFVCASIVGLLPGTVAVVLLGNALTGGSSPWMLAVSASLMALGIVLLIIDVKTPARRTG